MHEGPYRSEGEYQEEFEALFEDAVRLTLRSDVPVGAYLSGGIDSSLVVAAILALQGQAEDVLDRLPLADRRDARGEARSRTGSAPSTTRSTSCPSTSRELPKAIWHLERPIGDALILAYWQLARETSKHLKVVLSGEGADENYAGYSFHKIISWAERYRKIVPRAREPRRRGAGALRDPRRRARQALRVPRLPRQRRQGEDRRLRARVLRPRPRRELRLPEGALGPPRARAPLHAGAPRALERGVDEPLADDGRPLPRPPAPAPVRRLAAGQPAAPPGQEHDGFLARAALPVPRPPRDRAGVPHAAAHEGARTRRTSTSSASSGRSGSRPRT